MRRRADDSVDALMRRSPAVLRVFLDQGLLCPGCPFARLHSLDYAAQAHRLDAAALRLVIEKALASKPRPRRARKVRADP